MSIKSVLSVWFPMWFPSKALEELKRSPDRSPELFQLLANQILAMSAEIEANREEIEKLKAQRSE